MSLPSDIPREYGYSSSGAVEPIDWNTMCQIAKGFTASGTFVSPYSFTITKNGSTYYACNAFQTVYSGAAFHTVFNTCVTALTSGGCIHLTKGTFTATGQLVLADNIRVSGEGMQSTIISFDDTFTLLRSNGTVGSPKTGVQLDNFTIQGTNTLVAGIGIELNYTFSNTNITNVQVKNVGGIGVKLSNCYAIQTNDLEIANCNDYGFLAYSCHGSNFHLKVYDCGLTASTPNIGSQGCSHATYTGTSEGWHGNLMTVGDGASSYVPECTHINMYFEGSTRVAVISGYGIVLDGSRFIGNGTQPGGGGPTYALVISGTTTFATQIKNCFFRGGFSSANIWVAAATVEDTTIEGCTNYEGLFLDDDGTNTQYSTITDVTDTLPALEEADVATILEGDTYVEITHVTYQPDADWFTVNCISPNPAGGAIHWWLARWTETTTRIYVSTTLVGGNMVFHWRIKRPRR
jgi:hypothetical protein